MSGYLNLDVRVSRRRYTLVSITCPLTTILFLGRVKVQRCLVHLSLGNLIQGLLGATTRVPCRPNSFLNIFYHFTSAWVYFSEWIPSIGTLSCYGAIRKFSLRLNELLLLPYYFVWKLL